MEAISPIPDYCEPPVEDHFCELNQKTVVAGTIGDYRSDDRGLESMVSRMVTNLLLGFQLALSIGSVWLRRMCFVCRR